jgi:hypothetical protein
MGDIIRKDFQYKKIKNFLHNSEIELLKNYTIMKHRSNTENFDTKQSKTLDTYFYGDPMTDSLMLTKLNLMEQETGLKLLPTYSFWRMYTYAADLKEHKDRDACEISVTVMIGSDGTSWPIYMGDTPIDMEPGDACIYLGCELNHSRKEFEGDWHSQAFLHYVDANGPKAKEKFDGRAFLV